MEHTTITTSTRVKNKTDNHETEPFDKILQTLINSVSSTFVSEKPNLMSEIETRSKECIKPGKNGISQECTNIKNSRGPSEVIALNHSLQNHEHLKMSNENGKSYPNFWPRGPTSPNIPLSLDQTNSETETFETIKSFSLLHDTNGNDGNGPQRFRSKSANKSGNGFRKGHSKKITSKTAKSKKTCNILEDLGTNTDWMTVLEERSMGPIIIKRDVDREDNNNFYGSAIIDDDESSSFMTEDFHPRNIFTAGSSDATSIGWADDAVESESTHALSRQWAQVEQVFHDENEGIKPEGMSDTIYQEVLLWRESFNTKSKRNYNFHRNANMSISLHISDNFSNPSPMPTSSPLQSYHNHRHSHAGNLFNVEYPSPTSLLPEFDPKERRSPDCDGLQSPSSLQRQTSALSMQREKFDLDLRLPHSMTVGPSFLQSWLENLTTHFDNNGDQQYQEQEHFSLPTKVELELQVCKDETDGENHSVIRRLNSGKGVKVPRPISSQYLNRSWTKEQQIGRTTLDGQGPRRSRNSLTKSSLDFDVNCGSGDYTNAPSDNRNLLANRCLSSTSHNFANEFTSSKIATNGTRKPSAWSRHAHLEEDNLEEKSKREQDNSGKPLRKNFISWLLFDENDENIDQQDYNLDS